MYLILLTLAMYSAKELEHYERVRKTFDSSGESHKDTTESSAISQESRAGTLLPTRPKSKDRTASLGKGKGKAPARDWVDFEADDERGDDEEKSAGNSRATPNGHRPMNGWAKGKAENKTLSSSGFGDPSENDEEELYG